MMTNRTVLLLIFALITIFESLFFGFILAGWSSYLYVIIDLGFYYDLCLKDNSTSVTLSNYSETSPKSCTKQQEQLQLLFAIGFAITVGLVFMWAPLMYRYGTVKPKMLSMLVFNSGILMLGLAKSDVPLVIVPGIVGVGLGGYGFLISNVRVSTFISTGSAIYVALINGAADSSGITFRFFKLFHDNGLSSVYSTVTIIVFNIIVSGTSVLFHKYWPHSDDNEDLSVNEKEIGLKEKQESAKDTDENRPDISLRDSVCCHLFFTLTFWFCVPYLVYIMYIGIINKRLEDSFPDDVSFYTNMLVYINLGGLITAFLPGFTNEWQIYIFKDVKDEKERHLMPLVLPLCITSIFAALVSGLTFFTSVVSLYAEFVALTVQKSFMFISLMQFVVKAFPVRHGTFIYSVITGIGGAFTMMQYVLFRWYNSYPGAPVHVKTLMTVLSVLSLIHPITVFLTAKGVISWKTFYRSNQQNKSERTPTDQHKF